MVVGAGYTGLSAARVLAQAGASVLVLEREQIGSGASSRNGGQALAGLKLEPAALVARFGERRARELFEISREALGRLEAIIAAESIDCGYVKCGHAQCASKPSHFDALRAERDLLARTFGHEVQLVRGDDQRSEIGSDAYYGLLVDERSGALNPALYVEGLARAVIRAGAAITVNTPALTVRHDGARFAITTPAGTVDVASASSRWAATSSRPSRSILRRDLVAIFPQLRHAGIDYAWGGNVAFARDQMPRAGRIEGQYYACGYAGHGVAMATYLGELVARRIAGEPIEHPLFDDGWPPIPLYHGRPWFLPIVGAYYRFLDWIS